jgi:hypothetical protein
MNGLETQGFSAFSSGFPKPEYITDWNTYLSHGSYTALSSSTSRQLCDIIRPIKFYTIGDCEASSSEYQEVNI